ncbi:alpha/beta-type small acid-soluble spore protein [Clostridium sp.]|uniref:alpha/beta-type small acid-soluble spore protein n=1 Tax=Clostridium sp. TaxID=1506 RepID=UPI00262DCFE4|nr:alpha/beta-type small acid-soluble spore protein [Clostridium sp.]
MTNNNNYKNSELKNLKNEVASEVGVQFSEGYNGDLSSRQCGSVGGGMVKKMVEQYKGTLK